MSRLGPEHARIQALLSAYLDGEVSPRNQSAVEEHLEGCEVCTEELRTLRQTVELLHTLPAVAPRRSFTLRYLPVEERRSWWAWSFPYLRSATAAALALFVLVVSGDLAARQFGFAQSPATPEETTVGVAPSLAREAPLAPADLEGEPAAAESPDEEFLQEGAPEDAAPADRALEQITPDAAAAPVSEAVEAPAEAPPEGQAIGEAETTPAALEAATPIPAATTPVAEATAPVPTPLPPEPVAPEPGAAPEPEPAPQPAAGPVVAREPVLLTLLRWAEVGLLALLIPLGIGTLVAWRISSRAA